MKRLSLVLVLLAACGSDREPVPPPRERTPPRVEPAPLPPVPRTDTLAAPQPQSPPDLEALAAELDEDTDPTRGGLANARVSAPSAGPRCGVEPGQGMVVWPKPGAAATAYVGSEVIAAVHVAESTGDELVLLAVGEARARPIVRIPLSPSTVTLGMRPPVVADLGGGRAGIASVDRAGKLLYAETNAGRSAERRQLASDADSRFAPAVAASGTKRLVAYVRRGTPSKVALLVLDAGLRTLRTVDATPEAGGAASPFFVPTQGGPVLVLVDPREGMSPIYRVPIDAEGNVSHGVVLRPVTGLVDPARVIATATTDQVHIAYVAHGSSLASAVGYVRAGEGAPDPVSLVRPTGFGALWVDGVSLPSQGLAVFAATAPLAREPTSPRAVHVRAANANGLGEATTLTIPEGLVYPSLAVRPDGLVLLTASTLTEVSTIVLRCTS